MDNATVSYSRKEVINRGVNTFEAVHVEVSVTRPCKNNDKAISKMYDEVVSFVDEKVEGEAKFIREEIAGKDNDSLDGL